MNIKRTVATVTSITGLLVLFVIGVAAQYGHPGVNSDPTPLVQAPRPRKQVPRPTPRVNSSTQSASQTNGSANNSGNVLAANKPPAPVPTPTANPPVTSPKPARTPVAVAKEDPIPTPKPTPVRTPTPGPAPTPTPRVLTFEDYLARAEQADDRGDARAAAEAYRQALALKPDSPDAHWGLAAALYDQRDYIQAISEYQAALAAGANEAGV